jgi:hypothetical protein
VAAGDRSGCCGLVKTGLDRRPDAPQAHPMTEYTFHGRLLPEVRRLQLPWNPRFKYSDPRSGLNAEFEIQIHASMIHVRCSTETPDSDAQYSEIMVRSFQFCSTLAHVITFCTGWALQVIIDSGFANGKLRPIALSERRAVACCQSFSIDRDLEEVADLALNDLSLAFALGDLAAGVGQLNYSSVAAGRALDTLRHAISGPDMGTAKGWELLRDTLHVSESYAKSITEASAKPRHGERGKVEGANELAVLLRAWTVVDRFIEFKKRGGKEALPLSSYPTLDLDQQASAAA